MRLRSLALRSRASLEDPPAMLRRCAHSDWKKHAAPALMSALEESQVRLVKTLQSAAQKWQESQTVEPESVYEIDLAATQAEEAVAAVRESAVAGAARVPWTKIMSGTHLVAADSSTLEKRDTVDALAGKTVGLYFTASWCGPCHRFTPRLVQFYERCRRARSAGDFEVVLVSWDDNEADQRKYASSFGMPWLAVPHQSRALSDELTLRYGVTHIPSLVILQVSADGKNAKLVSTDGRADVDSGRAAWISMLGGL